MTNYTKTMGEVLESMYVSEDNVGILRDIVKRKQAKPLKFADGKMKVDLFTASAVTRVLDKVNPANKTKITKLINTGKKANFMSVAKVVMKSENDPEVEEENEGFASDAQRRAAFASGYKEKGKKKKEEVEIEEGKYLKYSDLLLKKARLIDKKGPDSSEVKEVNKEIKAEMKRLGIKEEVDLDEHHQKDENNNTIPHDEEVKLDEASVMVDLENDNPKLMKDIKKMGIKVKDLGDSGNPGYNEYELTGSPAALKKGGKKFGWDQQVEKVNEGSKEEYQKFFNAAMKKFKIDSPADLKSDEEKKKFFDYVDKNYTGEKNEEVELDEGTKQVLAHGGKGKYKVTKDGDTIEIKFGGKVVGTADFDRGADSFFVSMKGQKGQKSFDDAQAIADYFAKNKITEEVELDEEEDFKPHKMYDPKTGEAHDAKTMEDHLRMKKMGYTHEKPKVEESAASDARRAMAADPSTKQKFSKNVSATDDDVKAADKNIMMQMRKAVSLRGNKVEFMDKKKVDIPQKVAQAVLDKYNSQKKPSDKEKFQAKVSKSYKSMLTTLKEQNEINNKNNSLHELKSLAREMKGKNNG